jgi:hypothetical protein
MRSFSGEDMKNRIVGSNFIISLLITTLMGCNITNGFLISKANEEPTIRPPTNTEEAETEIINFMLSYKIGEEYTITVINEYANSQCDNSEIEIQFIIYYGIGITNLKTPKPKLVWCYFDNQLFEIIEKENTMEEFYKMQQEYDSKGRPYHLFVYHIDKLNTNLQSADIIFAGYCGITCGGESKMKIFRKPNGEWQILEGSIEILSIS